MTLHFPVAANPDAALQAPLGFAMREREAVQIAAAQNVSGEVVSFVTDWAGPAWPTEEAARGAYADRLAGMPPGWWSILPVVAAGATGRARKQAPLKPTFKDGRRWAAVAPEDRPQTAWRLSIRYWRVGVQSLSAPDTAARKLRKDPTAAEMEARTLRLLAEQPLRAAGPQRALDIGPFEFRPPGAPPIIMPDE